MMLNIGNVICIAVLDYLFVRVFDLGICGIAIASLLCVAVVSFISVMFFLRSHSVYHLGSFTFSGETARNMLLNGSSEFIGEFSMCISMYAYNWVILRNVGGDGVAAFAVVGYLSYIFSMVVIGFGQGMRPLVSFSFGADDAMLSKDLRKKTNLFVLLAGIAAIALMFVATNYYSTLFLKNDTVNSMLHVGIRIFVISFLFSGVNSICSMYFTSIGKAKESAVISCARDLVALLTCIFTLPKIWNMTGAWFVAPVTEAITLFFCAYYLVKERVTRIKPV